MGCPQAGALAVAGGGVCAQTGTAGTSGSGAGGVGTAATVGSNRGASTPCSWRCVDPSGMGSPHDGQNLPGFSIEVPQLGQNMAPFRSALGKSGGLTANTSNYHTGAMANPAEPFGTRHDPVAARRGVP